MRNTQRTDSRQDNEPEPRVRARARVGKWWAFGTGARDVREAGVIRELRGGGGGRVRARLTSARRSSLG
jgi:hypothetical protein